MPEVRMTQITALILHAVGAGYRYGFDLMDATGLASGTVYPALRRLEAARMLRSRWEEETTSRRDGRPRRRLYELTAAGEIAAAEATAKLASQRALLIASPPLEEA
ncbi:MAG: helix-turn-helix transcriptional regulator [Gemmatimonadales bacterium]